MTASRRATTTFATRGNSQLVTPKGMGDLLPPEAAERRALAQGVLRSFELYGYALVTPPVFEHSEVVERGNETLNARDLMRFVEPESGEVAVLRPDITPQIARIVATRLATQPPPLRLCYEGRVFRRQRGRARSHRQISQAGVECVGLPGTAGDTEVVTLAVRACEDAGLSDFRIELSDIRLVRSLLEAVPEAARAAVSEVMAQKDRASLRAVVGSAGASRNLGTQLEALLGLYGDREVLDTAYALFRSKQARTALDSLREIVDRLSVRGLGDRICFDLSDTRGLSYYTGMHFSILAPGPGEALGGGGRYDDLLGRFGFDAPATGFALDLGHLQWTLRAAGRDQLTTPEIRVVVAGRKSQQVQAAVDRLRKADVVAATLADDDVQRCLAFARAWGYDGVVALTGETIRLLRATDATSHKLSAVDPELIRRLARGSNATTAAVPHARAARVRTKG